MRIGEVAARSGVSIRSLRYYDEQGLLTATRSAGGQREYPDTAVGRVALIQQLYAAGLTSARILEMLPCLDSGRVTPTLLELLETERNRINAQIGELELTRDKLSGIIATAMRPGPGCHRV